MCIGCHILGWSNWTMARWVGNVACIGQRLLKSVLIGKPKGKMPIKGPMWMGEVNIEMYCIEIGQDGFDSSWSRRAGGDIVMWTL